jgi:stress-induced morphogen
VTSDPLKKKIYDTLKKHFPDDTVDVSEGWEKNLHVVVVSRKFDGLREREKLDLLWSLLEKDLTEEELGRITLTIGLSPAEIK